MTAGVIAILRRDQLPEGRCVPVIHPPGHLVVVRIGDDVFAFDHACAHAGASLLNAEVDARTITCSAHGCAFDLRSGALVRTAGTSGEALRQGTWPVERCGEDEWVVRERVQSGTSPR